MPTRINAELIQQKIFLIRGHKVMIDRDLAELYGVTTGNLNKAVNRNLNRFPDDFMFQLTSKEATLLRFQFGSLKRGSHFKYFPYAFTEQGVAMLSSVLRSERAVEVNIQIIRVFVKLREILVLHKDLAAKLEKLEQKVGKHDKEILIIFEAIRQLMAAPPEKSKRRIGFHEGR